MNFSSQWARFLAFYYGNGYSSNYFLHCEENSSVKKRFSGINLLFWSWYGYFFYSRCWIRLLECIFPGEPKANLETVTREAVFNIESRKSSHFKTRTVNLCLKTFASYENSFHSVECNFFSQWDRFQAIRDYIQVPFALVRFWGYNLAL